jgi:hypothetical protein
VRIGCEVFQVRAVATAGGPDKAVNFVIFRQQQLGQIRAVLAFDAGDEGAFHWVRHSGAAGLFAAVGQ